MNFQVSQRYMEFLEERDAIPREHFLVTSVVWDGFGLFPTNTEDIPLWYDLT